MQKVAMLALLILASLFITVGLAQQPHAVDSTAKPLAPVPMATADSKAVLDAYNAVVSANKDFQIALLKARITSRVDETWGLDLATMTFTPPAAKAAAPTTAPTTVPMAPAKP